MQVAEIRPDHLMQGQAQALEADLHWLLQHKEEFVHVPCPACGSETGSRAFKKYSFNFVTCDDCGTMYVSPRPTIGILEEYYSISENGLYWDKHLFPSSEQARREKIFRPRAKKLAGLCKKFGIQGGTLIDVGAGDGTFCEVVKSLRMFETVMAIEPSIAAAETCNRKGLALYRSLVEVAFAKPFTADVITSFEVIEHLFSPRDFLLSCARVLTPGGLLVITCPNVKGFEIQVLQELSDSVDFEHLNYFHPSSLRDLVTKCGFEVLEIKTPGELDVELVRRKIASGELNVLSRPFLKQVLVDRIGSSFQHFLAVNLLSSHMWLVARR